MSNYIEHRPWGSFENLLDKDSLSQFDDSLFSEVIGFIKKVNNFKIDDIDELLDATRKEDNGNAVWEVFNRVQERLVNGNYHYMGTKDKPRKARPIKNFKQNFEVNKKLSELAFAYV